MVIPEQYRTHCAMLPSGESVKEQAGESVSSENSDSAKHEVRGAEYGRV
jgi:hypothetical protein